MKTMELLKKTLISSIHECDAHLDRMKKAQNVLSKELPFNVDDFPLKDDMLMAYLDQYLYRFTKLQDSMAHRLCGPLYGLLEGTTGSIPFIDLLNKLEKYNALSSVDSWNYFRMLRNNMAHDYPESINQNVDNLNLIFSKWSDLEALYLSLKKASSRFTDL